MITAQSVKIPFYILFLLFLLMIFLMAITPIMPHLISVGQQFSHAVNHNAVHVEKIRKCVENNQFKPFQLGENKFLLICQIDDGRFGLMVTKKINNNLEEITSYLKRNFNSWEKIYAYIEKMGGKEVYNFIPGNLILLPEDQFKEYDYLEEEFGE